MYTGEYEHSIDDKGRVIVPSKFRQQLHDHCFLTRGYNGCVNLYADEDFKLLMERLLDPTKINPAAIVVQRRFAATEVSIDSQGRLPLSKALMDWAGISSEQKAVVLFGTVDRIEIWSKERWDAYNIEQTDEKIYAAVRELSSGNG